MLLIDKPGLAIATLITLVLAEFFMSWTSFRDPGIIPKNKKQNLRLTSIPSFELYLFNDYPDIQSRREPKFSKNGFLLQLKYCDTCNIFRPPRTSHCYICDYCIEKFDHHCPWLGSCIGKKNYFLFFIYLFLDIIHIILCLVSSIVGIVVASDKEMNFFVYLRIGLYSVMFIVCLGVS